MTNRHIVTINSGSSSIKYAVFEFNRGLKKLLNGNLENIKTAPLLKIYDENNLLIETKEFPKDKSYEYFFELLVAGFSKNFSVAAVGHRVVHGGLNYTKPIVISKEIMEELKKLIPFAPLHQPYNLQAIECITKLHPELPQVACFDTAYHHTHPPVANRFGIPRKLYDEGIRRYGFHGLSYEYVIGRIKKLYPNEANHKIIVAHLGNGASMCAISDGKSIDSTMGFTALDGLVMGTRSGAIDPGVLIYLNEYKKMSAKQIETMLYKESGLLGVSGITHNMKQLLEDTSEPAKEAIALFVYRIRYFLGALTAVLNGLDRLVFTGGIGENSWQIRERVCENLNWLGLEIDSALNKKNSPIISTSNSKVIVNVIPTNEEWVIANHMFHLLN